MESHRIKLVALDFDLTIYDYADPPAIQILREWFIRLDRAGVACGLCSGRSRKSLRQVLGEVGIEWNAPFPRFVIADEGYLMPTEGEPSVEMEQWNRLRTEAVEQLAQQVQPIFEREVAALADKGLQATAPVSPGPAGLATTYENPPEAWKAFKRIQPIIARYEDAYLSLNHHILMIVPRQFTKGTALAELGRLRSLALPQILAVGDNLNDRTMLCDRLGFTVATVANADPLIRRGVRAAGGFVASKKIAAGVCEIFAHHFPQTPS